MSRTKNPKQPLKPLVSFGITPKNKLIGSAGPLSALEEFPVETMGFFLPKMLKQKIHY